MDVGVQLDKMKLVKNRKIDCPKNSRYLQVGLRLGYQLKLHEAAARYNGNQEVTGAPSYSFNGPYIKLVFGYGTKIRKLNWKN